MIHNIIKMASYAQLFENIVGIARKYHLDGMLTGYRYDLVNILMRNHLADITRASDYEKTMQLFNRACASHLGYALEVSDFISDPKDKEQLYEIFSTWRIKLLAESTV
jgi:hypothetical protein